MSWLHTPNYNHGLEFLRRTILVIALLLVVIPLITFGVRRKLHIAEMGSFEIMSTRCKDVYIILVHVDTFPRDTLSHLPKKVST